MMAAPEELSMDSIRAFMLSRGGTVTNHELVRHFRYFLSNEETKVQAKMYFKEYVNTLAHISKNEHGEKYLTLKPRYQVSAGPYLGPACPASPSPSYSGSLLSVSGMSVENLIAADSPGRVPPPYRPPPPPVVSPQRFGGPAPPPYVGPPPALRLVEGQEVMGMDPPPPVPPRRRSSDRSLGSKENLLVGMDVPAEPVFGPKTEGQEHLHKRESASSLEKEPEAKISVKERTQKFNRMASEGDTRQVLQQFNKKKIDKGADEEEARPLDQKDREWLAKASQVDYQALAKLAAEKPKLVLLTDPCVVSGEIYLTGPRLNLFFFFFFSHCSRKIDFIYFARRARSRV
ncbi:reticulon-4-like [Neocloeon triangulifer]|uniref:reticulon-4-like n=1 Tax=Neocloeon triangulifer TaxID=2078957 RepID=UPI00286F956A|nr:reticulon-4-like [Neocloeon triangulifer]